MKFDTFIDTYKVGKGYDYDGAFGCQCVDLLKFYIDKVLETTPQSIGDAKEYWAKRNQAYLKGIFTPVKGDNAKRGDVFIRTSGTHGHCGMVTGTDKKGFFTIEQNAGGCGLVKHLYHPYASDMHFLRPKNQSNITNQPNVAVGDKVTLTNNNVIYKSAAKTSPYSIGEISQFYGGKKAQLKSGRTLTVQEVKKPNGNIWLKTTINEKAVFVIVYDKKKDKSYIKA